MGPLANLDHHQQKKPGAISSAGLRLDTNDRDSSGLSDTTVSNTARTNAHPLRGLPYKDSYALEVGIPTPVRQIVGVTDAMSMHRAFSADFASLCHSCSSCA